MLKRKLSLEQTWIKCLKMWKEMIEVHWKPGMTGNKLKEIYFENHPKIIEEPLCGGCYFCDYDTKRKGNNDEHCSNCPGRLINKKFDCHNESYHYDIKPKAFYRKLLELNTKRKSKK